MAKSKSAFTAFLTRYRRYSAIDDTGGLLAHLMHIGYLPSGSHQFWGEIKAERDAAAHKMLTSTRMWNALAVAGNTPNLDPVQSRLLKRVYWIMGRESLVPIKLVTAQSKTSTKAMQAFEAARATNDFSTAAPSLQESINLARELAGCFMQEEETLTNPYEVLLQTYEPGFCLSALEEAYTIIPRLKTLLEKIAEKPAPPTGCLHTRIDSCLFERMVRTLTAAFGFDSTINGRIEFVYRHPYCTTLGPACAMIARQTDSWITDLRVALHECGHGRASQAEHPVLAGLEFEAYSLGLSESQSRFFELLMLGPFAPYIYEVCKGFVPEVAAMSVDDFEKAINWVRPHLVRTESDELHYMLHILLRVEFAQALLSGDLSVEDFPGEWDKRMQRDFGLTPKNLKEGCLQDVHWFMGAFGYFPTYMLGSMAAVQLWQQLSIQQPIEDYPKQLTLINTRLDENFRGNLPIDSFAERMASSCGGFDPNLWMRHMEEKYAKLYSL